MSKLKVFRSLLESRIEAFYVTATRNDVSMFVKDVDALKIWSLDYFHDLAKRMPITAGEESQK